MVVANPLILARVHSPDPVDDGWTRLELVNGLFITVENGELESGEVGALHLVSNDGNAVEPAPNGSVWPSAATMQGIAEVLATSPNRTLLRINGLFRFAATPSAPPLAVGDWVVWDDQSGIQAVLTEQESKSLLKSEDASAWTPVDLNSNKRGGLEAFGGSQTVVNDVKRAAEANFRARAEGSATKPISGVILYGNPGTGKTFLVRCLAESLAADLFVVNGPEVMSRFVGATEQSIRDVFEAASGFQRSIIFFDEFDSIAPDRSRAFNDHVRIQVGQLLATMDSATSAPGPLVIASTNRLEDIDPAFRRPGRFELEVELTAPVEEDRVRILRAQSPTGAVVDQSVVDRIAAATTGWSPADLGLLWTEASLIAFEDSRAVIRSEDLFAAFEYVGLRRVRRLASSDRRVS